MLHYNIDHTEMCCTIPLSSIFFKHVLTLCARSTILHTPSPRVLTTDRETDAIIIHLYKQEVVRGF